MRILKTKARLISSCAMALPFIIGGQAYAQVDEIIVTSQRRAESTQDIPISVQAFDANALKEQGVSQSEDVLNLIPNATIEEAGGSKKNIFIRGVGTSDFHLNAVSSVGVYLDDVSLNSPFSQTFSLFDLERVEVLRGPQNTLYGRNTTGGAITFVSKKPELGGDVTGDINLEYGSLGRFNIEGGVGIPLGENAGLRIAAFNTSQNGFVDNLTRGTKEGSISRQGARAQLLWEPQDNLEILARVHGGVSNDNPASYRSVGLLDPNDLTMGCSVSAGSFIPQISPNCVDGTGFNHQTTDFDQAFSGLEHIEEVRFVGGAVNAKLDLGGITLTSVSAYDDFNVYFQEDSDGSPATIFQFYQDGDYKQYSQEFRLQTNSTGPVRFISGLYWFLEEADYATVVRRTPASRAPSAPGSFNVLPNTVVQQDNKVLSAYGQLEYDVSDALTATVGLRLSKETKKGQNDASVRCVGTGGPPFCPQAAEDTRFGFDIGDYPVLRDLPLETLDYSDSEWGARFALDYKLNDNTLVYASASRGFKSGGFSVQALQAILGNASQSVDPEILWAYELGAKTSFAEDKVQLNASVFHYDWDGLQSFQVLAGVPQLLNIPKSKLQGAEVELKFAPGNGFYGQLSAGVLDTEVTDAGGIVGLEVGNELTSSPEFSFNGLVRKEFELSSGVLAVQADYRYQAAVTYDILNNPSQTQPDGTQNLGARVSYDFGSGGDYVVSAWADNITGEEFFRGATNLSGLSESIVFLRQNTEPTFGIGLKAGF